MTAYSFRDKNIRKTWAIFIIFLIVVIGIGFIFARIYNNPTVLYMAIIFSLAMNLLAYWKSDKIAIKLSGAVSADKNLEKEIFNTVENLSITSGIPAPKIYISPDMSSNAFAAGRNPKNASIVLTRGIIQKLDRSELEGVIAHELSHIKNYDILLSTVVVVLVGFISLISDIFMRSFLFHGRRSDNNNRGGSLVLLLGIAVSIIAPIIGILIQLAISRKREFLADASGALLTRYPDGLISALEKISKDIPMKNPREATAHLFFASPFKSDSKQIKTSFFAKLFLTHPPIEERIEALRKMA